MTTPTVPQFIAPVTQPYVTVAQFSTYPTWLDLDDLVPGNATQGVQDAVLADVLLKATQWAVNTCEDMPLQAHLDSRNTQARTNNLGRIVVKPAHIPVRAVTAFSYGWDPTAMTSLSLPDASQWIEDGRSVSYLLGGAYNFVGPAIQFGRAPSPSQVTFISWTYVAGFVNTTLAASANSGANAVTVADPTGILPGGALRIWDDINQATETAYVATTWTPTAPWPSAATSVPLAAPLQHAHAAGVGIADMPQDLLSAVVQYAIALLMRQDVSEEEPFPGAPFGGSPSARKADTGGAAAGLVSDAERAIAVYRPTRWGN